MQYFKNMIAEVKIHLCNSCRRFFHQVCVMREHAVYLFIVCVCVCERFLFHLKLPNTDTTLIILCATMCLAATATCYVGRSFASALLSSSSALFARRPLRHIHTSPVAE